MCLTTEESKTALKHLGLGSKTFQSGMDDFQKSLCFLHNIRLISQISLDLLPGNSALDGFAQYWTCSDIMLYACICVHCTCVQSLF